MYVHRVIIDFEHEDYRDSFADHFDNIVADFRAAFAAHDVWISGIDVTEEHQEHAVVEFNRDLGEFLESLHYKDYPHR